MTDIVDLTLLQKRLAELQAQQRDLPAFKSGGSDGSGIEARIAKLEASVEHIQKDAADIQTDLRTIRDNARIDFRLLFGAILSVSLGLAGLMARGFHWL